MTSTVLDVTVLLLCVSASVVALGPAGSGVGSDGPPAADVADRVATETVTVTYEAPDAPNGTRTVHATRAELLAMIAVPEERGPDGTASSSAFEKRVRSAVDGGLGPRTRIDVRTAETPTTEAETGNATDDPASVEIFGERESVGRGRSAAAGGLSASGSPASEAVAGDAPWWSANETGTPSWPTTGTGTSWGVELSDELKRGASRERRGTAPAADGSEVPGEVRTPLSIGSEPPRGADTTVAVLSHPAQGSSDRGDEIRITVRRW
ncbi:hypothetical protein C461_14006 [Halorubrum aidingense JCM 13560]|uniref:Uncharacterized protein n=1 Tax=Halorubrum aidingense JCM 13560 TaxID=1230454 RepID=M0PAF7_9EURY|nr:hypothetical protein [Halorubrum aidingense]EMA65820.1 hypothetical protein C461_14006 [Halorubrum aidingense JCM 13560]